MQRVVEWFAPALFGFCLFFNPASAASPEAVPGIVDDALIVDTAFDRLSASLFRLHFQRLPQPGEDMHWINPDPKGPSISVRPGKTILDTTILWLDPHEIERVTPLRAAAVAPVLSAVSSDGVMRALLRESANTAAVRHGVGYPRSMHANEAGKAQVAAVLKDRDSGTATVMQLQPLGLYSPYVGPVALSWDDRQVLISARIQRYRKVRGKHLNIRDLGPPIDLYFVGAPSPEGVDPVVWWSENGGEHLQAELREGFQSIFGAALGAPDLSGKAARGALTAVQIGDRVEQFRGTLIDESDDLMRIALGKQTLLLVRTKASR
jgi:hypothetical protein